VATFHYDVEDAIAFSLDHFRRTGLTRFRAAAGVLVALGLGLSFALSEGVVLLACTLFFVVFGALMVFRWRSLLEPTLRRQYGMGKNLTFLGVHRVSLHEHYLRNESPVSLAFYRWEMVEGVQRQAGLIMIYISAVMAVLVPERAFANAAEADAFYAALMDRYEVSRVSTPDLRSPPWVGLVLDAPPG